MEVRGASAPRSCDPARPDRTRRASHCRPQNTHRAARRIVAALWLIQGLKQSRHLRGPPERSPSRHRVRPGMRPLRQCLQVGRGRGSSRACAGERDHIEYFCLVGCPERAHLVELAPRAAMWLHSLRIPTGTFDHAFLLVPAQKIGRFPGDVPGLTSSRAAARTRSQHRQFDDARARPLTAATAYCRRNVSVRFWPLSAAVSPVADWMAGLTRRQG